MNLPELSPDELLQQQAMRQLLKEEIQQSGGAIPFDRYMELALYAPGLGYYVSGAHKFGKGGDFVTAPEISPLFGHCLGRQCAQLFEQLPMQVLEFGAGTGAMAIQVLQELQRQYPQQNVSYLILELSPELKQRQRDNIRQHAPALLEKVSWVDEVPRDYSGVVLANEVLDAMPVQVFRRQADGVEEQWVTLSADELTLGWQPATPELATAVAVIEQETEMLAPGYVSEINLRLMPWVQMLAERLQRAAVLLVDYGYLQTEYYHPQRNMGTLICHYRHHAHDDVLLRPGLQDITANVDFSAVHRAAVASGLDLLGFNTQANFLLGCGLDEMLSQSDPDAVEAHMAMVQGAKQLIMPDAMGERFKVIALGKGVEMSLRGFSV